MQREEYIQKLGLNIRQLRKSKGLTLLQLSDICNIEKSNLIRIELGKTNPTTTTLKIVADALELRVADLFSFEISEITQ